MNKQDPEAQRLEDEQMEPTEDTVEPSGVSVFSEADASTLDEEPASVTSSAEDTEKTSDENEPREEPVSESSVEDKAAEEVSVKIEFVEDYDYKALREKQ